MITIHPLDGSGYLERMQRGRREMASRCQAVAKTILNEAGVTSVEYHNRGLSGWACSELRWVTIPPPTTRRRLYIVAHEAGHVALGHIGAAPRHREEFEAEKYAHAMMRRHGIAVPRRSSRTAKDYVAWHVESAVKRGATMLDRESVDWCWSELMATCRHHIEDEGIVLCDLSRKPNLAGQRENVNS